MSARDPPVNAGFRRLRRRAPSGREPERTSAKATLGRSSGHSRPVPAPGRRRRQPTRSGGLMCGRPRPAAVRREGRPLPTARGGDSNSRLYARQARVAQRDCSSSTSAAVPLARTRPPLTATREPVKCVLAVGRSLDQDQRESGVAEGGGRLGQQPARSSDRRALEARIALVDQEPRDLRCVLETEPGTSAHRRPPRSGGDAQVRAPVEATPRPEPRRGLAAVERDFHALFEIASSPARLPLSPADRAVGDR
jgi:hypothetical protein